MRRLHVSLVARVALAIGLLVILPSVAVTTWSFLKERRLGIDTAVGRLKALTEASRTELDAYIVSHRNLARYAVGDGDLRALAAGLDRDRRGGRPAPGLEPLNGWLSRLTTMSDTILASLFLDPEGRCLASSDPGFVGEDLSFRAYFREASKGLFYVSDWTVGTTAKVPGIFLSAPVLLESGSLGGVLVLKLDTRPIDEVVARVLGVGAQSFVLNSSGVLLSHYDPGLRYHSVAALAPAESRAIAEGRQFGDLLKPSLGLDGLRADMDKALASTETILSAPYTFRGQRKLAALARMKSMDWVVGTAAPFAAIEASSKRLLLSYLPLLLLVSAFAAIASVLASRQLAQPLALLLDHARRLGRGEYLPYREAKGLDEVVELERAFDDMAWQIREDKAELETRVAERTRELKEAYEEIKALSNIDALTGCHNRRYMDEHLEHEMRFHVRYGRDFSVIMCDIDHFKSVNDRHGHSVGDLVLKEIGALFRRNLRDGVDWVVRYGGEEFLVVLPATGLAEARVYAERLRELVASLSLPVGDATLSLTASFGVAVCGATEVEGTDLLLREADERLYRAKREGRDRVVWGPFTPGPPPVTPA